MSAQEGLVERLRNEAVSFSASSLRNGCQDCGITSTLVDEVADRITSLESELAEARRDVEAFRLHEETLRANGIASHSEAVVRVLDAEQTAARLLADNARQARALTVAVSHIEHMAAWIRLQNAGYSFESLGEDMPGIKAAMLGQPAEMQDSIRVPLHELQADVDYLFGRVVADSSCAPAMAASLKTKLAAIDAALAGHEQAVTAEERWRDVSEAPKDGTPIRAPELYRYKPYSPEGRRQMRADGRWQKHNGYGWENSAAPTVWMPAEPSEVERDAALPASLGKGAE